MNTPKKEIENLIIRIHRVKKLIDVYNSELKVLEKKKKR